MTTPTYKGPGQPLPAASSGLSGLLDLFGTPAPVYKTTPTPTPTPTVPATPACPLPLAPQDPCNVPVQVPVTLPDDLGGDAVIPVGPGPITIIIQPRS